MPERYRLDLTATARRTLSQRIPPKYALAIGEFIVGPLLDQPKRVGKLLDAPFTGYLSARKGPYRVIYQVDDVQRTVHVIAIDHRADVYRPS
jgi:mRNA-degrading endonuclease RelE of RelBE toxin-antitoxin system